MKRLLVILAVVTLSGCASSSKHVVVTVDNTLYEALNDTFKAEQTILAANTPDWTLAQSQKFNKTLLPAVSAGRQLNTILAGWKDGQPIPAELHDAITAIVNGLKIVTTDMPPGSTRTKILEYLSTAQSVILTALNATLALVGG